MKKIYVWIKHPGEKARHVWMSNREGNIHNFLNGPIAELKIATDLVLLYAEGMEFSDKHFNKNIMGKQFFGSIIFAGPKGEDGLYTDCPMDKDAFKTLFPELLKEEK